MASQSRQSVTALPYAMFYPKGPKAHYKLPYTLYIRSTLPAADRRKRGSWLAAQRLQNKHKSCLVRDLFV